MKTLPQLIASHRFDYVNSKIEKHFTATEVPKDTEYKLFHFGRYISSEDAVKEIEAAGYRPANISELLSFDWNDQDLVVALGSVARVNGDRNVPYLREDGSERRLNLLYWSDDWSAGCRFLAVRTSSLSAQKAELGNSDTLSLPDTLIINGRTYKAV